MQADGLSIKERSVLFALLAEAREVSNPELEERIGIRLDGKERRKLNDLRLVDSRRPGRAFLHELSDAGWRWCADELSAGPRAGSASTERALYAILGGLGRYLQGTEQSLADIFKPTHDGRPAEGEDVAARIVARYYALASEPGEFVKLAELYRRLTDVPQADVVAALDQMYQARRINLIPQSNQRALSAADRESALRIGGEFKHLISIEKR